MAVSSIEPLKFNYICQDITYYNKTSKYKVETMILKPTNMDFLNNLIFGVHGLSV